VFALVVLAVSAVAALFLVPKLLGYDTYVITTGSMRGTADPGSLVIAQRRPTSGLAVGDVITYAPPATSGVHHLVTHRIVTIGKDRLGATAYRTKGDANAAADPWTFTLLSDVQPVMRWSVPWLGKPVLWLADPTARKAAIGVPAGALALMALVDVVQVLRRRDEDDVETAVTPDGLVVIDLTDEAVIDLTDALPAPTHA
jgi:signal peptidase